MIKRFFLLLLFLQAASFAQSYAKMFGRYQEELSAGNREASRKIATAILEEPKFKKELEKNSVQKAELLNTQGNALYETNSFEEAASKFSEAAELVKVAKGDTAFDYGFYTVNLACVFDKMGRYAEAEKLFYISLPILGKGLGASSPEYTMFYKVYVDMKIEMGDYSTAKPLNDGLLYYYKTMYGEKNQQYLNCLNNAARIYQGQGDFNRAMQIFEQLIGVHRNTAPIDTANYATILNNAAESYRQYAQYDRAEELYLLSYKLSASKLKSDPASVASLLNNMALMYKAKGNYNDAEKCFLKSIELYKKAKMDKTPEYTNPLNNMGDLYRIIGRYKQAYEVLLEAIAIRKITVGENHESYANALNNMALLYQQFGYLKEAEELFRQCSEIYRIRMGENHQLYANSLNNLAMVSIQQKKYGEAEELKLKALGIIRNKVGENSDKYALYLSGMTNLYLETNRFEDAIKALEKAAAIFKNIFGEKNYDYIETLSNMAEVYRRMKKYDQAQIYYVQSLNAYQQLFENYFAVMSEEEKTAFYYQVSHRFESFDLFVFQRIKDEPRVNHDKLVEAMYNYRLVTKSLLLNETNNLHRYMSDVEDTSAVRLYSLWIERKQYLNAQYKLSKEELTSYNINIDALEKEVNTLEKQLNAISAEFNRAGAKKNLSWEDVRAKLKPGEAAVEIVRTEEWLNDSSSVINYGALILVAGSGEPRLVSLEQGNQMDKIYLAEYKKNIEERKPDVDSYKRYWAPVAKQLSGVNKIYFSADGAYQQINLYTLKNTSTNKYLIEEVALQLLTTTKDLLVPEAEGTGKNTARLFGYPDYEFDFFAQRTNEYKNAVALNRYGFSELPPLPGTKQEVDDINGVLKKAGWQVDELIKDKASEQELKKVKSPKVLHIATHGFFLPDQEFKDDKILGYDVEKARENPLLRSGIMLAGASVVSRDNAIGKYEEDGILTAYEASLLNLQGTELVVLSACETGLGEVKNGQGVYGLQRAFMIAGAKTMVMSLWVVDDNATQELMTAFYSDWIKDAGSENKLASFRKAQLKIKEKYKDPYYWGAFVMVGK
ncbi:MAG: CHAT domain-containing tetratricopeptide repeat protein [Bacteroidia bacterium]